MIWFDGSGDADSIGEDDMQISAITTYFLSGTGNTRRVASWMADEAVRDGVRTTLVPIDKVRRAGLASASHRSRPFCCF